MNCVQNSILFHPVYRVSQNNAPKLLESVKSWGHFFFSCWREAQEHRGPPQIQGGNGPNQAWSIEVHYKTDQKSVEIKSKLSSFYVRLNFENRQKRHFHIVKMPKLQAQVLIWCHSLILKKLVFFHTLICIDWDAKVQSCGPGHFQFVQKTLEVYK